ncbi:MAG: 3-hydroxyacyl-CoA dehydrogenase NAD-binding domain-containing protein [Bacteroidia bacterium]|nr:3-hydroxyacyl-CoA dehydrogenase NAD-binding domain-containing protein [Bacteroidia bacterium]
MIDRFTKVAVIGAGTMGNGIAHVFAQSGYAVNLIDVSEAALGRGLQAISQNMDRQIKRGILDEAGKAAAFGRIQPFSQLAAGLADRDFAVEAATERIDLKINIFKEMDQAAPAHAILASNTSSISITRLAAATKRSAQVIGMHFMNPVPVMKLVEVISGYDTSEDTLNGVLGLSRDLGKIPVPARDYPGFVSNRILMPMINEAIYTHFEGVAGVEEIDQIMKLGMAHPMGPLELADFIGLDVCLAILEVLHEGFGNPKYAPCPLLRNMVAAGHLGKKSGKGFYTYPRPA